MRCFFSVKYFLAGMEVMIAVNYAVIQLNEAVSIGFLHLKCSFSKSLTIHETKKAVNPE